MGRSRFRRVGGFDRPAGCVYHPDGIHVTDEAAFYLAMGEAVNGPGGYFGCNLDAMDDCLRGRFGARTPFTVVLSDFQVARESLTRTLEEAVDVPSLFEVIQTIFRAHDVDVVLS